MKINAVELAAENDPQTHAVIGTIGAALGFKKVNMGACVTYIAHLGVLPPTFYSKPLDIVFIHKGIHPPHIHDKVSAIVIVVSGTGVFKIGNTSIPYEKNSRFDIPVGVVHGFNADEHTCLLCLLSEPICQPDGSADIRWPEETQLTEVKS